MWFQVGEPLGIYAIGLFDGWDGAHRLEKKKKLLSLNFWILM